MNDSSGVEGCARQYTLGLYNPRPPYAARQSIALLCCPVSSSLLFSIHKVQSCEPAIQVNGESGNCKLVW